MGVMKRAGSPYWYYEFQFEGERYRGSTKQTNKRAALEVERDILNDLKARKLSGYEETWTLGRLVETYRDKVMPTLKSKLSTETQLRKLVDWFGADTPLTQIDTGLVARAYTDRVSEGYKATTVILYLGRLRTMLVWLRKNHPKVAQARIDYPEYVKSVKERVLSHEEEQRLLEALDPDRDIRGGGTRVRRQMLDAYHMTILMLDTGARISEATTVTWEAINWETQEIELYRVKTNTLSNLPITPRLMEVLRERREITEGSVYVFPSVDPSSSIPHASTKWASIPHAMDRAGLNADHLVKRYGRCTVHTLRHTFITRLAERGLDPWTLQDAAGHQNINTTLRYVHRVRGRNTAAVRAALTGSPQLAVVGDDYPQYSTQVRDRA